MNHHVFLFHFLVSDAPNGLAMMLICVSDNCSFAIGMWIYQSLDAIDGKQARRTGTSGPLGELFDHGERDFWVLRFFLFSLEMEI